jgi:hypothetical protein
MFTFLELHYTEYDNEICEVQFPACKNARFTIKGFIDSTLFIGVFVGKGNMTVGMLCEETSLLSISSSANVS